MAKTAAERKRDFDQRMRNEGGRFDPSQPERKPTGFYLREEALEAIRAHRDVARIVNSQAVLDSEFVEAAILEYAGKAYTPKERNSESEIASKVIATLSQWKEQQADTRHKLEHALVVTELQIQRLERELKDAKRRQQPAFGKALLALYQEVKVIYNNAEGDTDLEQSRRFHRLLLNYLAKLA